MNAEPVPTSWRPLRVLNTRRIMMQLFENAAKTCPRPRGLLIDHPPARLRRAGNTDTSLVSYMLHSKHMNEVVTVGATGSLRRRFRSALDIDSILHGYQIGGTLPRPPV